MIKLTLKKYMCKKKKLENQKPRHPPQICLSVFLSVSVSGLLSVERFSVSRVRDFLKVCLMSPVNDATLQASLPPASVVIVFHDEPLSRCSVV